MFLVPIGILFGARVRPPLPSSFASKLRACSYGDRTHQKHGALRVINEDRVAPNTGFGTHGHQEFEIFSYVVSGQLSQYVVSPPVAPFSG